MDAALHWLVSAGLPAAEQILGFVISALASLVLWYAARGLRRWAGHVADRQLRARLLALAKAAEQVYGAGTGDYKRDFVLSQAQEAGLKVKRADLESVVWDLKHAQGGDGNGAGL